MKKKLFLFLVLVVALGAAYACIAYYPYVFSKSVKGKVVDVQQVMQSTAIIQGGGTNNTMPNQVFSFAVAIQDEKTGEIFTASSEDRRWAVVHKGQCAEARFFPYPAWNLQKANTYFGARLEKLSECP